MERRLGLWLICLGFMVYLLGFSPPLPADWLQPLDVLLQGQFPRINPVIIALFSSIGSWLLIYSRLVFVDGRMQAIPAWVFMLASLGTGIIGLMPYLALRELNQQFLGQKNSWLSLLESRSLGIVLLLITLLLLIYAVLLVDWPAYVQEFQTNRFIHGMSLAFCLFALLFPYPALFQDDLARRGLSSDSQLFCWVAALPLFGPLIYLCIRPPLLSLRKN